MQEIKFEMTLNSFSPQIMLSCFTKQAVRRVVVNHVWREIRFLRDVPMSSAQKIIYLGLADFKFKGSSSTRIFFFEDVPDVVHHFHNSLRNMFTNLLTYQRRSSFSQLKPLFSNDQI